jgi:hypothetical protein
MRLPGCLTLGNGDSWRCESVVSQRSGFADRGGRPLDRLVASMVGNGDCAQSGKRKSKELTQRAQ